MDGAGPARGGPARARSFMNGHAGRPTTGWELVENLAGSKEARAKLRMIFDTIYGTKSVGEACGEVGIGEAAFHKMRAVTLERLLEAAEPRRAGRKKDAWGEEAEERVRELERTVRELRNDLGAFRVREELAMAFPWYAKRLREKKET